LCNVKKKNNEMERFDGLVTNILCNVIEAFLYINFYFGLWIFFLEYLSLYILFLFANWSLFESFLSLYFLKIYFISYDKGFYN
jgi:hypothetical protein